MDVNSERIEVFAGEKWLPIMEVPSIGMRLGGPDNASNRFLQGWPYGVFICPLVENRDARLQEFLRVTNFENGSSLFHGESALDIKAFRDLAKNSISELPDSAIHQIFVHWVQRVRSYNHIESLAKAGIVSAKIPSADHLTPTTCIGHSGRSVNVIDAQLRIGWMKTLPPEKYSILAYGVDFGFPPFDLKCTCRLEGIIPGLDYDLEETRRSIVTRTKWDRLNHIHSILSKNLPDKMSESKFNDLLDLMLEVSEDLSENPHPQAKLERLIGEALIARDRKEEGIKHLEKALFFDPKVGVKKLLFHLKSDSA